MTTSHLCAASVLRTNPVACGYQLYDRPFPSLSASNSASLFSKPSALSVENGMLFGSAQTRSTFGSISSIDNSGRCATCASIFPHRNIAAIAVQDTHKPKRNRSLLAEFVIGARPQIDEYVLDVTHDIAIGAERGHDVFLRRVYVLAPVNDNVGEVGIILRLQVTAERWRVTRSFAVGPVTDVAIRMIAT